tara:strand:+ start:811 stop:1314 length:504 start_codon:yes stop_codon:yes gene_type:complete
MNKFIIAASLLVLTGLTACVDVPQTNADRQAAQAQQAAEQISFTDNAEIENITRRLELTSSPGLVGYVLLLNDAGQPIYYVATDGKLTSGGKRLTKPFQLSQTYGEYPTPSDEGTWSGGGSLPYVYFWSTSGQYYQWSGDYLFSDQPFRLNVEPLVVDIQVSGSQVQ